MVTFEKKWKSFSEKKVRESKEAEGWAYMPTSSARRNVNQGNIPECFDFSQKGQNTGSSSQKVRFLA